MRVLDTSTFLLPLFEGDSAEGPFLGCSFFINRQGWLATCAHNLAKAESASVRLASSGQVYRVEDVRSHETSDFAVARTNLVNSGCIGRFLDTIAAGQELWVTGCFSEAYDTPIQQRTLRGYITRIVNEPPAFFRTGPSALELSFPSVSGFSGAPVISHDVIIGMLFGNTESEVTVHRSEEIQIDGRIEREHVKRVQEFGLAHSVYDLAGWASDLGVRFSTQA